MHDDLLLRPIITRSAAPQASESGIVRASKVVTWEGFAALGNGRRGLTTGVGGRYS